MPIKKKELKTMAVGELKNMLEDLQKELIKENAQVSTGTSPKNPGSLKAMKKNIARIITLINQKEAIKSNE